MSLIIPEGYKPVLNIRQTEHAIKKLKDYFERTLAYELKLIRVSAPLFVFPESGLNDDLNGIERPVKFGVKDMADRDVEIIHSLAKWKRMALQKYGFSTDEGLYTDMNAIRRDEELDNLHSIYVDQWDWEMIIDITERNIGFLESIVKRIYRVFKETEEYIVSEYPALNSFLPNEVRFISTQELEDIYPNFSPKQREDAICKEFGAVFLSGIGHKLSSGQRHDGRAPDYDDWRLNGDLLFWYPVLNRAVELSSMGIRVDGKTLMEQLNVAGCMNKLNLEFHQRIINGKLPFTIGGGLGQSRICMFFLGKAHIGEVQASIWSAEMLNECEKAGINLL